MLLRVIFSFFTFLLITTTPYLFSTLAAADREQDHDGGDDVDNVSDNADEDFKEPNKASTVRS